MPTYDYSCEDEDCLHEWDDYHHPDEEVKECPKCGKNTASRMIGRGSCFILKGSGFHAVDYKDIKKRAIERSDKKNPLLHQDEANDSGGVSDPDSSIC